jgi:hypothetical protein
VYGISGLVDLGIPVDYSTSIGTLYQEATAKWISVEDPLVEPMILGGIGSPRSSFGDIDYVPSWVVDMASPNREPFHCSSHFLDMFSYSGTTEKRHQFSLQERIIWIEGVAWDTVAKCLPKPETWPDRYDIGPLLQEIASDYLERLYPTGMPILQVLFRLLLSDLSYPGYGRLDIANEEFVHLACSFIILFLTSENSQSHPPMTYEEKKTEVRWGCWTIGPTPLLDRSRIMENFWGSPLKCETSEAELWHDLNSFTRLGEDALAMAETYLSTVANFDLERFIFQTSNRYLGLGPPLMKEEDVICIISGFPVPYILRPEGSHFLLVGPCFVMGIMDGEAI